MVIALFGDSCTGKSTIAAALAPSLSAEVFSGKDYLKLAKSESVAAALFQKKLRGEETILYVIFEKDQLALLPEGEEAIERFIRSKCKGKPLDRETQRKLAAALQRRGFSWQEIRPVLNRLGEEMAEE